MPNSLKRPLAVARRATLLLAACLPWVAAAQAPASVDRTVLPNATRRRDFFL